MSLRNMSSAVVLATALFAAGGAMAQDATIDQVYQAANAGRFADAQSMMDKVLHDHPNSAKAHYVEAELLAKQGKMSAAEGELSVAQRIDPSGNFAKPGALQELKNQLAASHNAAPRPAPVPQTNYVPPPATYTAPVQHSSGGGSGLMMIIVVLAVIAFIVIVARAIGRRTGMVGGGYAPGYGPGGGYAGGYGPGGMPMMGGGGMGSGIIGGLATGAAVGAGLVAGEELMHHFTDGDRGGNMIPPTGGGWDNSPPAQNTDMGGNDFGVSDSGSWDSGGGGGDSGGGGGGDW